MQDQSRRALVPGSGIISLILTLGIARFAYTPLLPVIQDQTWLGIAGRLYPTKPAILMGKLTPSCGVAQVIAPALAGHWNIGHI